MDHDDVIERLTKLEILFGQHAKVAKWLLGVNLAILAAHADIVVSVVRAAL